MLPEDAGADPDEVFFAIADLDSTSFANADLASRSLSRDRAEDRPIVGGQIRAQEK